MKLTVRRVLNLGLYLVFCLMVATGLLMEFRLPPGSQGGQGLSIFGLGRHDWGGFHLILGYLFIALTAAHLVLAWPWLKKVAAKGRLLPVIGGLAVGLLIIFSAFFLPVEDQGKAGRNAESQELLEDDLLDLELGRGKGGPGRGEGRGRHADDF